MNRILAPVLLVLALLASVVLPARADTVDPTPIVFVHGYSSAPCQGLNAGGYWSVARSLLNASGFPYGQTYSVSYYRCDTNGVDVTGSGPGTSYPVAITAGHTRAGYDHIDTIGQIAHDLAWFLYDRYGTLPVDLVGHSMGGLIVRYALMHVAAGDPAFPPSLAVSRVVTFGTPYAGAPLGCKDTQCTEMAPGSSYLVGLRAASVAVPTTSIGSGCDLVPATSATAVGDPIVYSYPCYQHMGYLGDSTRQLTSRESVGGTGGRRALYELVGLLTP